MPFRIDYGTIGEAQRTPQGGLAIPADLTRAGVFVYRNPDGSERREWRPLAEVQRKATLDSLKAAPLTVRHPAPGRIAPENHDRYSRGHVGDDVRMDGDKTAATLYAQGKEALDAIGKGWRHVSCGYDQDTVIGVGVVPAGEPDAGQRYDAKQTNIVYNHVAIVPKGRAGDGVRLRLDAAGDSLREDSEENEMKIEIIGGTEYEVGTPAHADARKRQDTADSASAAEVTKLRSDAAEAKGALAAASARLTVLETAEKQRADEAERVTIVAKAQPIMGKDWKADGKNAGAIAREIIAKQFPAVRLDEIAEAERPIYIKALLAGIPSPSGQRADAAPRARTLTPLAEAGGKGKTLRERREDAMDQPCGPNFTLMRGRPMGKNRGREGQSTQIESQR